MDNLKNCYFCGAQAPEIELLEKKVLDSGNLEGVRGVYLIQCKNCGAKIEHDDKTELVSMWNYVSR